MPHLASVAADFNSLRGNRGESFAETIYVTGKKLRFTRGASTGLDRAIGLVDEADEAGEIIALLLMIEPGKELGRLAVGFPGEVGKDGLHEGRRVADQ